MANTKNYSQIRKPAISPKGFSSYASSLAKKQATAEDSIIDNQYDAGQISPETYLSHINTRLTRQGLTPNQVVTLREKITTVREKVQDAEVDNRYARGELKTSDVLAYEQEKLNRMPATDSAAYLQQQQKVQQLTDKTERERRTAFRVSESLRISQMPEDTSERMLQKARMYEQLEVQARTDGDNQTADTLATSKNNYVQSAKRAQVNDLITQTRQSVSETLPGGLGVPDANAGSQFYSQLTGSPNQPAPSVSQGSGGAGGGGGSTPVVAAYSGGGNNRAITSAFESLDRSQKNLQRIAQERADKTAMLQTYDQAIAQASGDQKTTLTIARNNIASSMAQLDNSEAQEYENINDKVTRINEAQSKAAFSSFKTNVSKERQALDLAERKLEDDLKRNKIAKDKYLFEAANLMAARIQLKSDESSGYRQFGEDDRADQIDAEVGELQGTRPYQIYQTIASGVSQIKNPKDQNRFIQDAIKATANNYELVRVSDDGTLNNISGKTLRRGDLTLMDVTQEKLDGTFKNNYVKDGNVYSRVYFPKQVDPVTGQEISIKDPERIANMKGKQPYYVGADGQAKPVKIVKTKNANGEVTYTPQTADFVKSSKYLVPTEGKNDFIYELRPQTVPNQSLKEKITGIAGNFGNPFSNKETVGNIAGRKLSETTKAALNLVKSAIPGRVENGVYYPFKDKEVAKVAAGKKEDKGNFITNAVKNVLGGISNFIAPPVEGGEYKGKGYTIKTIRTSTTVGQPKKIATPTQAPVPTKVAGVPDDVARDIAQALKEQGIYSPETMAYALATVRHETAGSYRPVNEGYYNDDRYGYEPGFTGRSEAKKRGYSGGEEYFGRGYIQLTHDYNYKTIGDKIGVDLVNNPDLANDPKIAAKILAVYMRDRGTADLARKGKFVDARGTINPDNKGFDIANNANAFLKQLKTSSLNLVKPAQAGAPEVAGTQNLRSKNVPTSTPTPTVTLRSGTNKPVEQIKSPIPNYTPAPSRQGPTIGGQIQGAVTNAVQSVKAAVPKINVASFNPPKITLPTYKPPAPIQNVVRAVQQAPQNIVKSVQNVAQQAKQAVTNFVNKYNPFKKK